MQYFKMASDKEYNADLAAVCSEEKKFILRALQYCQDDASRRKGGWYDLFARCFFFSLDLFDLFFWGVVRRTVIRSLIYVYIVLIWHAERHIYRC